MDLATTIEVEGDYFRAMGIPLLHGRLFTPEDKAGAQLVVIVNRKLAEQSWPGQDPIGKRLRFGTTVDADAMGDRGRRSGRREGGLSRPAHQAAILHHRLISADACRLPRNTGDLNGNGGYIALRTAMPPEQMENALRATVRSIDPQLPLSQVQTMEHAISDSEAPRRFNTALIASFAAIAVLLAVLGIYSVIAFSVAQRVQEMAIRMALGSQRSGIVRIGPSFRSEAGCGRLCHWFSRSLRRFASFALVSLRGERGRSAGADVGCGVIAAADPCCVPTAGAPRRNRRPHTDVTGGVIPLGSLPYIPTQAKQGAPGHP